MKCSACVSCVNTTEQTQFSRVRTSEEKSHKILCYFIIGVETEIENLKKEEESDFLGF